MSGAYSVFRVYRSVYESNREVFRAWGYRTDGGGFVSLGDKAAFLAATKVYDKPLDIGNNIGKRFVTETDCVNADCAEVAKGLIDCGLNPAILNLASRHHACGGYDSGAGAQEESLCRVSTLSQTLYQYFDPSLIACVVLSCLMWRAISDEECRCEHLGNLRLPMQFDVGIGDAVTPSARRAAFPVLLGMDIPKIPVCLSA